MEHIKTKEQARQYAIDWQSTIASQPMSYTELAEWNQKFYKLAQKFRLVSEFKENGII